MSREHLRTGRAALRRAAVALGLSALVACAEEGGPRLDSVVPAAARHNDTVTLAGRGLCGARHDCAGAAGSIQLGLDPPTVRAIVVSYADTAAQIVIPPVTPVGRTALVVTVNEQASNALDFEVLP